MVDATTGNAKRYTVESTHMSAKPVSGIQLTQKTKIIIGVVIGLVVLGAIIGVVAYFVSVKPKNKGLAKFGTLQVTDTTSNSTTIVEPGDVLQLKFNPNPGDGFTGLADWAISFNAGQTYTTLATEQSGNTYKYTVPDDICSDGVVFKVTDSKLTNDFVVCDAFSIRPLLRITDGPGTVSGATIYLGTSVVTTLDYNSDLDLDAASDWRIDVSIDSGFSKPIPQAVTAFDSSTKQLTWTPSQALLNVYVRVSTTAPVGTCTNALSAEAPYAIDMAQTAVGCTGSVFKVCSVTVLNPYVVDQPTLLPGEGVSIRVVYPTGTYTGDGTDMVVAYILDNATPVTISVTGTNNAALATFTFNWTVLTSMFTTSLQIKITKASASATSQQYTVRPGIVIDTLTTAISVTATDLPLVHAVTTSVHVLPIDFAEFTTWAVGITDADPLAAEPSSYTDVTSYTNSDNIYALTWSLTPTQLGLVKVGDTVQKYVYFKATNADDQSTVTRSDGAITFTFINWTPTYAPFNGQIYVFAEANVTMVYDPANSVNIPFMATTTTPTNQQYWYPTDINLTTKQARICNYNPASPPTTPANIMCVGSTTASGFIAPVAMAAAPLITFSHNAGTTTFPICATTTGSLALTVGELASGQEALRTLAGNTCNGTYQPGLAYNWSVNPFF